MELSTADMSKLYNRHAAELLRFFMRRTFDHQLALDLVGETYAVALESRTRFRGKNLDEAKPWLYGIGANLLSDFFRSGQIERRAMDRLRMEPAVPDESDIARIDELAGVSELRRTVAQAVSTLAPEHREVLELRIIDQRGYDEIAQKLDVSEQTARARVSRALKRLRELVDEQDLDKVVENA